MSGMMFTTSFSSLSTMKRSSSGSRVCPEWTVTGNATSEVSSKYGIYLSTVILIFLPFLSMKYGSIPLSQ
eukprot:2330428-Amphidinium_carterae.1